MEQEIIERWFGDTTSSAVYVITDNQQYPVITQVLEKMECNSIKFINIDKGSIDYRALEDLQRDDMIIVALSIDSFIYKGYNSHFSPFSKPRNVICRYVFIRLDITKKSLVEGLETEFEVLQKELGKYLNFKQNSYVQVTSPSGTDITFKINKFKTCSHFINEISDLAFLPPSELEAGIVLGTANGIIVVDITVGQINQYGKWLGEFGLVDKQVKLTIKDNYIVDIVGNDQLKKIMNSLEPEARVLVELGKGLSQMTPTGIIGVDESILSTCHFGIGDGSCVNIINSASIHLDVVVANPTIKEINVIKKRGGVYAANY